MKQGTLTEIVPRRRRLVIISCVCEKYSSSGNNSFVSRCWVETCNGKARDCNHWGINKVSIIGTDLDSMKKDSDHFRGHEKYGLWMNLCNSRLVVPCEDPWPLEKIMIFHGVDFGLHKYKFYLDMWDTPGIWRDEVLLDIKEIECWQYGAIVTPWWVRVITS